MPKFIVTANKLNRRSIVPASLPDPNNIIDVVLKNFIFEADEVPDDQMPSTVHDKWYKDKQGRFYWGGGINELRGVIVPPPLVKPTIGLEAVDKFQFDPNKMSWAHDSIANGGLGIVDLWNEMGVRGEGVKVAVIDTGAIDQNNDLKGKINKQLSIDCVSFNNITDTNSPEFHGTRSAGLIAANTENVNTVCGVAPDSELIIYRLFTNENLSGYSDKNFCFVLQEARKAKVDIISMSFTIVNKPADIDAEIKACLDQNILLIASAGDENQSVGIKNNFPASLPGCISVGAYHLANKTPFPFIERSCKSDFLLCLAPGENILTTGGNATPVFHQFTSAAAPFLAGIFSCMISFRKKKGLPISVKGLIGSLEKSCDRIDKTKARDEVEGLGVVNPFTLFNSLNK
jgi:hypothetical protein